ETPVFVGRAVAALCADPKIMSKTGKVQVVAELAKEYGFSDTNGLIPPSIRSLRFMLPAYVFPKLGIDVPSTSVPDWLLPFDFLRNGKPPE
ncbi:unnamed protein product, partial [Choristocarpus tenellus]